MAAKQKQVAKESKGQAAKRGEARKALCLALRHVILAIKADPGIFHGKEPDYSEGLNATGLNTLAKKAGLGPIIEWGRESDRGVSKPWIIFNSPDNDVPVKMKPTAPYCRIQTTPEIRQRVIDYLRAWQQKCAPAAQTDQEAGTSEDAAEERGVEAKPELTKEARALATLVEHPEWSDIKIAKEAGCHVRSLYRWKAFTGARVAQKEVKADIPKGSKSSDGTIEAWDEV